MMQRAPAAPPTTIEARLEECWDDDILDIIPGMARISVDGRERSESANLASWKADFVEVARRIASYEPDVAPKGKLLERLLSKKTWAQNFLKSLDKHPDLDQRLSTRRLRVELGQYLQRIQRLEPKEVKASGGPTDRRKNRLRKLMTLDEAFLYLFEMDMVVKGGRDSDWIRLAEIIFYLATGREPDDLTKIGDAYLQELAEAGMDREARLTRADERA
jgi:hypothetical protein